MDEQKVSESLRTAAQEVLETMFFASVLEEPEQVGAGEPPVQVSLQFCGQPSGTFAIGVDADAARTIAADFYGGLADEFSSEQVVQVICELANMVCGAALSKLESDQQFDLSSPSEVSIEHPLGPGGICESVYVPEGGIRLCVNFERVPAGELEAGMKR